MVSLRTVKRVLAVDLRLDAVAIETFMERVAADRSWELSDGTEIPLADALDLIARVAA